MVTPVMFAPLWLHWGPRVDVGNVQEKPTWEREIRWGRPLKTRIDSLPAGGIQTGVRLEELDPWHMERADAMFFSGGFVAVGGWLWQAAG
jgi:hypothetical protein